MVRNHWIKQLKKRSKCSCASSFRMRVLLRARRALTLATRLRLWGCSRTIGVRGCTGDLIRRWSDGRRMAGLGWNTVCVEWCRLLLYWWLHLFRGSSDVSDDTASHWLQMLVVVRNLYLVIVLGQHDSLSTLASNWALETRMFVEFDRQDKIHAWF